jgi:hypothetical protein
VRRAELDARRARRVQRLRLGDQIIGVARESETIEQIVRDQGRRPLA